MVGPRGLYKTLVSILASVVNGLIATVTAVVVDLSETERLYHKGNRWVEKWKNKGSCQ